MNILISAFKLVIRLIREIVHVVIIIMNFLPWEFAARFFQQAVIKIETALTTSILLFEGKQIVGFCCMAIAFLISFDVEVS